MFFASGKSKFNFLDVFFMEIKLLFYHYYRLKINPKKMGTSCRGGGNHNITLYFLFEVQG
jgi:hypothetical protein